MQIPALSTTIGARIPLRRVLIADAVISGGCSLMFTIFAGVLSDPLGFSEQFLRTLGLSLLPFMALVLYVGTRATISRSATTGIATLNLLWVVGSVLLLASGWSDPSTPGVAFVIAQALMVLTFAELQFVSLRHLS